MVQPVVWEMPSAAAVTACKGSRTMNLEVTARTTAGLASGPDRRGIRCRNPEPQVFSGRTINVSQCLLVPQIGASVRPPEQ
jgi:hypothetical protein